SMASLRCTSFWSNGCSTRRRVPLCRLRHLHRFRPRPWAWRQLVTRAMRKQASVGCRCTCHTARSMQATSSIRFLYRGLCVRSGTSLRLGRTTAFASSYAGLSRCLI
ncbi:hypothetical protein LPJ56_004143, partial [Coemansia sp. RSA 2599]